MDHLAILRRVAPEIIDVIERRYTVLQTIYHLQPIGRRALASRLEWPERMVRKEVEFAQRRVDQQRFRRNGSSRRRRPHPGRAQRNQP